MATTNNTMDNVETNQNNSGKIDRITALQDGIDSLSLAMFEALRGLRDAVAPESGNLGGNTNANSNTQENSNNGSEPDFDEFYQLYRSGDPTTVALATKVNNGIKPTKRDVLLRIHAKIEMEKDTELVKQLASTVLEKSVDIDERVSSLPGMHRTRSEQMSYIEKLLKLNHQAATDLENAFTLAQQRRDKARTFVRENTCAALGLEEDTD